MKTGNVEPFRPVRAERRAGSSRSTELSTDRVYVLFTSFNETLAAIPVASELARALRSRLTVVHFQPVSFGAPLEPPCGLSPVETSEFRNRLEDEHCEAEARVCVCRDARAAFSTVFNGRCLVVLGHHRRLWSTSSDRWRRTLEAAGHLVVMVNEPSHA
jgi:hypothetical protein